MQDAVSTARKAGAVIVENDGKPLQTGGRARNAGYRHLKKLTPQLEYVQFLDAGAALDPDWIAAAEKFMERRPEVAVIEGMSSGRSGASPENLTVKEQQRNETPGEIVMTTGPGAFVRASAFEAAGGFRGDLISLDMEDLCIRQRRRGAHVWRLETNMSVCDAPRSKPGHWSREARRRGFDNAYAMSLHGGPPERHGVMQTVRAVIWGCVFPVIVAIAAGLGALAASVMTLMTPPAFVAAGAIAAGAFVYLVQFFSSAVRRGIFRVSSWRRAYRTVFGRFSEFSGAMRYWLGADRP
jgi:hypothetical protein